MCFPRVFYHSLSVRFGATGFLASHGVVKRDRPTRYAHNWAKIGPIYWNAYRAARRPPGGPGLPWATEGGLFAARKTVVCVVTYVLYPDIGLQKVKFGHFWVFWGILFLDGSMAPLGHVDCLVWTLWGVLNFRDAQTNGFERVLRSSVCPKTYF